MITLKSESDIQTLLDKPSHGSIIELMKKDCMDYTQKFGAKGNEWIPRVIVCRDSEKMSELGFLRLKDGRIEYPIFSSLHPIIV